MTGPLVAAIEQCWAAIQARHPDVPDVVLTLGNGSTRAGQLTFGHFHAGKWATGSGDDGARLSELFIGGEGLSRGPRDLLGTLLHEAAHGVAVTRGIKDTSRQGRYHNTRFRELAGELGIEVVRDPRLGWSNTTTPDTTVADYADLLAQLDAAMRAHRLADLHGAGRASSNGLAATCDCDPPRKIRIAPSTYEAGPVVCGVCDAAFTTQNPDASAATADGRALARDVATSSTFDGRGEHAMDIDPWADTAPPARSRDAEMTELRQRRPGLFTLHEAAVNAVTAREHAHQAVARHTLDRAAALIDAGVDEQTAVDTARAELAADEAAEPEQLRRRLDEHARRVASPVIDHELEARVLAVPVTAQHIDQAHNAAERDLLIDLAACQHAITRLRDTRYTSTGADTAGLYVECREQHGHDRDHARAAAFLEVSEGIRAEHDTARDRLDAETEQRRDEQAPTPRRHTDARSDQDTDQDGAGSLPRRPAWEDVRAPLLRVGDVTPRGPITAIDYHGELGVTVHAGDEEYHRGLGDLVSRRTDHRDEDPSAEDSLDVDADELAQRTAGAPERSAAAARTAEGVDGLRGTLVGDHPAARQPRGRDGLGETTADDGHSGREDGGAPARGADGREVDPHTGFYKDELDAVFAGAHKRSRHATNRPDDLNRLRDTLLGDQAGPQHRRRNEPELHQRNAPADHGDVASREHRASRQAGEADQNAEVDGRDAVQRARVAVDLLTARRELDQRQRAEQARNEQVARWQHDDRHTSAETTSATTGGRAIPGCGWGR